MGKIEKIVIKDFKSYSGEQVIGPFVDFTCVIGPNGAGKSNVMDAICFVLGIAAKGIRADKLKDLIFRVGDKPPKAAEAKVTMHYRVSKDEVPGLDEGQVIAFSRTVTSKGTSEYAVNDQTLAADQYATALREINIDTKARNFLVFQGDVESIASKGPREMLDFFELVSGSAELKRPYEEAQTELEAARKEYNNKKFKRNEHDKEKKDLEQQKRQADSYTSLRESVEKKQTQIALTKLFYLDAQITTEEGKLELAQAEISAAAAEEGRIVADIAQHAKAAAQSSKLATKKAAQAESKNNEFMAAQAQSMQLEERLKTLRGKLSNAGGEETAAAAAVKEISEHVKGLEEELEGLQEQLAALEGAGAGAGAASSKPKGKKGKAGAGSSSDHMDVDGEGAGGAVTLDASERSTYARLKAQERAETADDRAALEKLQREQANSEAEQTRLNDVVDRAGRRCEELQASVDAHKARQADLNGGMAKTQADLKERQADLKAAREEHKKAEARMQAVGGELEEVKAALSALQAAASKSDHEKKAEAAVEDMRRLFPGVRGRLCDLISPANKKFNLAVTVALGRHAEAVVVDSEAVAIQCMAKLREKKVKPMTFLPLDTLQPKEVSEAVMAAKAKGGDGMRLARESVSYDDEGLDKAVAYAMGETLIVDELNKAMELRYKKGLEAKIVTIDGTVIAKNGNITGGSGDRDETSRGAARWDEKTLKAAETRRGELLQEEESLRRKLARGRGNDGQSLLSLIENTEQEIANLNRKIDGITKAVKTEGGAMDTDLADLAVAKKEVDEARPKLAALKKDMEGRSKAMAGLQSKMDAVADTVFKELCAKLGIASIRDYETRVMQRADEESKRKSALHDAIAKMTSKIDYEKSRLKDAEARLNRVRKEGGDSGSEAAKLEKEAAECRKRVETAKAEEAALRAEAEAERAKEREAAAARDKLMATRTATTEKKGAAAKAAAVCENAVEMLRLSRHDMLNQARMDRIHLPTKAGRDDEAGAGAAAGAGSKKGAAGAGRSKSRGRASAGRAGDDDEEMDDGRSGGVFTQSLGTGMSQGDDVTATDVLNGPSTSVAAKDKERTDRIDYSYLDQDSKDLQGDEVDARLKSLETDIGREKATMAKMSNTTSLNFKAGEKLEETVKKLNAAKEEEEVAKNKASEVAQRFDALRRNRLELLHHTFQATAAVVEDVYRELTRDKTYPKGGDCSLTLSNEQDPLDPELGGVVFHVTPPGKKYQVMELRSGGEKTMASLALLFAMQAASPSPFFIMDEIDAALDNVNVAKVVAYVRRRARGQGAGSQGKPLQMLVISLKDMFYEKADRLVGIYKENSAYCSKTLSLQLTGEYAERADGHGDSGVTPAKSSAYGGAGETPGSAATGSVMGPPSTVVKSAKSRA